MTRIFITGSSTGLGLMAAQLLIEQGTPWCCTGVTRLVAAALAGAPGAAGVVVGDLQTLAGMRAVAEATNRSGASTLSSTMLGSGTREPRRSEMAQRATAALCCECARALRADGADGTPGAAHLP